jgi:hypothetical protein
VTHGESVQQPVRSAQAISALVTKYTKARKKENQEIVRHGWEKPKEDYIKLNVDAAFHAHKGPGATGSILLVAGSNCIIPLDAATAEACALRDGLTLTESLGCSKLIINSDCSEVIDEEWRLYPGSCCGIYQDCLSICREFNVIVVFYYGIASSQCTEK